MTNQLLNEVVRINGEAFIELDAEIERLKGELKKSEPELRKEIEELNYKMATILSAITQFAEQINKVYGTSNK